MVRRDTDLQNSLETFLQNRSCFFFLNIAYPFRESVARSLQETDSLSPVDAERFMWDRRHRSEIHQCEIVLPPPPPNCSSPVIHTNRFAPHPLFQLYSYQSFCTTPIVQLYSYQSFCTTPIVPVVFIPIVLHHTHCSSCIHTNRFAPHPLFSCIHTNRSAPHPLFSCIHTNRSAPHPLFSCIHTNRSAPHPLFSCIHTNRSAPHPLFSCIHTNRSAPHPLFQLYSYQSFCTTPIVQLYSYQSFCTTPIVVVFIPIVLPHTHCSSCIHTKLSHSLYMY